MEYFPCPSPEGEPSCPYFNRQQACHEVQAHLYYPAADYSSPAERVFRNLPENMETRCRRFEEESHGREVPPQKPTREVMLEAITVSGVVLSISKYRKVFGREAV